MSNETEESGCLIRVDQLQAGDVILFAGHAKVDRRIRFFAAGKSPYSHAAIMCSPFRLFEADENGSGASLLPFLMLPQPNPPHLWLYLPISKFSFVVCRHADLQKRTSADDDVDAACEQYDGLPYSELRRLVPVSILPSILHFLAASSARYLQWIFQTRRHGPGSPGVYCSEVVTLVYQKLGFFTDINAAVTTPYHLFKTKQLLPVVMNHVLSEPDAQHFDPSISFKDLKAQYKLGREYVHFHVMLNESSKKIHRVRIAAGEQFLKMESEYRSELHGELHGAAQHQDRRWSEQVRAFISEDDIYKTAMRFVADASVEKTTSEGVAAYCAYLRRMFGFHLARTERDIELADWKLTTPDGTGHEWKSWREKLEQRRVKILEEVAQLPAKEAVLRAAMQPVWELRHADRSVKNELLDQSHPGMN
jgi:hypothetical protein